MVVLPRNRVVHHRQWPYLRPQAAYFTELFPASIRYSGASITYAIGAILGGAFAPLISAWLVQQTGTA